jgi:hypothetical protein
MVNALPFTAIDGGELVLPSPATVSACQVPVPMVAQ